ncbi:MAG: hypothetical protein F4Y07_03305 [Gemmatimonadetes bacterium]|nr:hypothetical protein [Gemmatimonadota bacterium]MYE15488.1 hypothetical protein [Gemmatimonadota bacterium]MYG22728.1 hypothetical protein [Gemmatimonadota bacterium]MYJ38203.1 hypothetical protein [Gemmatimonadota bacterium]
MRSRQLVLTAVPAALAILAAACEPDAPDIPASPVQLESRGSTVAAEDGFDLWFDAWGEGPAIIFLARHPDENRTLADALSDGYRVVIHEPRVITLGQKGLLAEAADDAERAPWEAHLAGRQTDWDPSEYDDYPVELAISDLHRVADAAGVDEFVLGGYSGTARLAAFMAPYSERAVGLLVGGYHIIGNKDYWLGYVAAGYAAQMNDPNLSEFTRLASLLSRQQALIEQQRDDRAAYGEMPGPRIVWVGGEDGSPKDSLMAEVFPGARIAERVRNARSDYELLGFDFFQLDGLGHVAAYEAVDQAAPLVREALIRAGWR